jgi:T-complex protein 1 subunit delta
MVDLSKAQDVEAGDGTTSVVVLAGALLNASQGLLDKGLHPAEISDAFGLAITKAEEILKDMAIPIDLSDRESIIKAAVTSLNSKVVSSNSDLLAPLAVDAVMSTVDLKTAESVRLFLLLMADG